MTTSAPAKVELIYFNAGGGHRAAALALQAVMAQQRDRWSTITLTDLSAVLDPQGLFRRLTGLQPEDLYNKRLASGFTLGLAQELKLLQGAIRFMHQSLVQRLRTHWLHGEPDLVVSLVPNFNRALCQSLGQSLPGVPFVTVMTDMADHPPNFWIEPEQPQHIVCGTEHAVQQARLAGVAPARIHRASGMILRPDFHAAPAIDRAAERQRLGLPVDEPTGLVLFGGHGSRAMLRIAERLADTPLILLCGRNEALATALRALPATAPRVVLGFTPDVARWMALADFFIGKPGPGSVSEAVQMGLPVIVTRNAWTMPQERWNTEWVRQQGVGVVHRSFRSVRAAVAEVTQSLPALRAQVAATRNRAVFEVPQILHRVLEDSRRAALPPPAAEPAQELRVRTVWISDLHLGTPGCQAVALLDFLKCVECDTLYLVGDIIDGWQLRRQWYWPQAHNDVVQKLLRKARKGTRVVFVPGNHDEFARKYLGHNFGGVDVVDDAMHRTADGRVLWITHGDHFDGVIQCAKWLAYVGDWAYELTLRINSQLNRVRGRLGLPYWSLSKYLKSKVKRAVSYVSDFEEAVAREARKRGADGVVCGHIHHAEMRDIGGVLYCNDGDWVESLTALVEHDDGHLAIVDWSRRDQRAPAGAPADVPAPAVAADTLLQPGAAQIVLFSSSQSISGR